MTVLRLIELALGVDEARKVDLAIPQPVFDRMTKTARDDVAGWYYDVNNRLFGRLLTQTECWTEIRARLERGELTASFEAEALLRQLAVDWPCFRYHAERGEITLTAEGGAS